MPGRDVLNAPYQVRDTVLDKRSIELLDLPNQRQIRNAQIQSILRSLRLGNHFDSVFVVNILDGIKRIRIIDGGHRTIAMKKYFEECPENKIKISMVVYRNLTPEEERVIYTKWNLGVKQSVDDFIESYKAEIPEYHTMLEELPVSIYGSKNKMKIRHVINAYFLSKQRIYNGGNTWSSPEWIDYLKKIEYADIQSIKDTIDIIFEIFNPTDIVDFTRLPAFKSYIFAPLFHLIHVNKVALGRNYVIRRMTTVLYNKAILESFKQHTRQGSVEVYNTCKVLLNTGVDHKFI